MKLNQAPDPPPITPVRRRRPETRNDLAIARDMILPPVDVAMSDEELAANIMRYLPPQEGGSDPPFDALVREAARRLKNRTHRSAP